LTHITSYIEKDLIWALLPAYNLPQDVIKIMGRHEESPCFSGAIKFSEQE
jgi:hypothetical protein